MLYFHLLNFTLYLVAPPLSPLLYYFLGSSYGGFGQITQYNRGKRCRIFVMSPYKIISHLFVIALFEISGPVSGKTISFLSTFTEVRWNAQKVLICFDSSLD